MLSFVEETKKQSDVSTPRTSQVYVQLGEVWCMYTWYKYSVRTPGERREKGKDTWKSHGNEERKEREKEEKRNGSWGNEFRAEEGKVHYFSLIKTGEESELTICRRMSQHGPAPHSNNRTENPEELSKTFFASSLDSLPCRRKKDFEERRRRWYCGL